MSNGADEQWETVEGTDGAALLDELRGTIGAYVVFPDEHAAAAIALWVTATHALPAFECAPRLVISSPQKRCAKSRLLDVIRYTCHDQLPTTDATVAAIFRSIGNGHPPTLLIDEADAIWGTKKAAEQNEDLRALLNAGFQRGRPALRCVGPSQVPTPFPTFAMAALAGIGAMPDTISDRAINISMRRRAPGETVAQFRFRRDRPPLENLRDRLAEWAARSQETLTDAEPEMPVEDRAADVWEPLIAIADAAGGHWPTTARAACRALVAAAETADEDTSLSTRLLTDIRDTFATTGISFLPTAQLITELRRIEDSPWADFDLSPSKLAYRLREFNIKPTRAERNTVRGYALEAFADAFRRYTRPQSSSCPQSDDDQRQRADASKPVDESTRPHEITRPPKTPAQPAFEDTRTTVDGSGSENGQRAALPGDITEHTPGMSDRVRGILARQAGEPKTIEDALQVVEAAGVDGHVINDEAYR